MKIELIRERIILYLRLIRLPEDTVFALEKETMNRISGLSPDDALKILLEVLKEKNITQDERFNPIFCDVYRPLPKRTPMGYRDFDPKEAVYRNNKRLFVLNLRRTFFLSLVLGSVVLGTWTITKILSPEGLTPLRWMIIVIFSFLFGWISINFWSVLFGLREKKIYRLSRKEFCWPICRQKHSFLPVFLRFFHQKCLLS